MTIRSRMLARPGLRSPPIRPAFSVGLLDWPEDWAKDQDLG